MYVQLLANVLELNGCGSGGGGGNDLRRERNRADSECVRERVKEATAERLIAQVPRDDGVQLVRVARYRHAQCRARTRALHRYGGLCFGLVVGGENTVVVAPRLAALLCRFDLSALQLHSSHNSIALQPDDRSQIEGFAVAQRQHLCFMKRSASRVHLRETFSMHLRRAARAGRVAEAALTSCSRVSLWTSIVHEKRTS